MAWIRASTFGSSLFVDCWDWDLRQRVGLAYCQEARIIIPVPSQEHSDMAWRALQMHSSGVKIRHEREVNLKPSAAGHMLPDRESEKNLFGCYLSFW